jgi:hypothetical protein
MSILTTCWWCLGRFRYVEMPHNLLVVPASGATHRGPETAIYTPPTICCIRSIGCLQLLLTGPP